MNPKSDSRELWFKHRPDSARFLGRSGAGLCKDVGVSAASAYVSTVASTTVTPPFLEPAKSRV